MDHRGHLWQPTKNSVICSQHFNEDDFAYNFGRKTVKPGALPTLFSFAPQVPKRKAPKRRTEPIQQATPSATCATVDADEQVNTVNSVDSSSQLSTFHSYSVQSPTKLRKENEVLRQKLALKVSQSLHSEMPESVRPD